MRDAEGGEPEKFLNDCFGFDGRFIKRVHAISAKHEMDDSKSNEEMLLALKRLEEKVDRMLQSGKVQRGPGEPVASTRRANK